jgi:predicted nucleotidyltransferase
MSARMENLLSKVEGYYDEAQEMMNGTNYSEITKSLRRKINGGKYYLFGSRKMGIATSESDLDLFIAFGKVLE